MAFNQQSANPTLDRTADRTANEQQSNPIVSLLRDMREAERDRHEQVIDVLQRQHEVDGRRYDDLIASFRQAKDESRQYHREQLESVARENKELRNDLQTQSTEFRDNLRQVSSEFRDSLRRHSDDIREHLTEYTQLVERQERNVDRLIGAIETMMRDSQQDGR